MVAFNNRENGPMGMVLGLLQAVLIIASVVVHELGHALVARNFRLFPIDITLNAFGGYTRHAVAPKAWQSLLVTLAGPTFSFILGFGMLALARVLPNVYIASFCATIGAMNLFWAFFNMLPMYPLDGGQAVAHGLALKWRKGVAERWAARVGVVTAAMVGGYAIMNMQIFLFIIVAMCLYRSIPIAFANER